MFLLDAMAPETTVNSMGALLLVLLLLTPFIIAGMISIVLRV